MLSIYLLVLVLVFAGDMLECVRLGVVVQLYGVLLDAPSFSISRRQKHINSTQWDKMDYLLQSK